MATTVTAKTQISWVDLRVVATLKSQNVSNNTSTVQFDVYLDSRGGNNWYGYGSTFSLNVGSGWYTPSIYIQDWKTHGGTYHVATWHHTIEHLASGKRSFAFSASMASGYGNGTASGSMDLPDIPRATEISTFSTSSSLTLGNSLRFSYTLDKKATSHISDISLVHRGITVATSNGVTSSNSTITINADNVDKIISRETGSSASIQMRLQTKRSNGTSVGDVQTKTISVGIATAGTIPTVNSFSRSIIGSSAIGNRDKTLNKPFAGYSRVKISASVSTMSGTSVSSVTLRVTGAETYSIAMVRNSSTGAYEATTRTLKSGTYYFDVEVKDSRGQVGNYGKQTYKVDSYTLPTPSSLALERQSSNQSKVDAKFNVKFASGSVGNIHIHYRDVNSTSWYNIYSATSKDGSTTITVGGTTSTRTNMDRVSGGVRTVTVDQEFTGFSETTSYQLRVQVNDDVITNYTYMYGTIGTATQLLTLNQDKGVGIGKFHSQGVLDVEGSAYFSGNLNVKPKPATEGNVPQSISIFSPSDYAAEIHYRKPGGESNARLGYFFTNSNTFGVANMIGGLQLWSREGDVRLRSDTGYATIADKANGHTHTKVAERGFTTSGGHYLKLYNGTMFCWSTFTIKTTNTSDRSVFGEWVFPTPFYTDTGLHTQVSKTNCADAFRYLNGQFGISPLSRFRAKIVWSHWSGDSFAINQSYEANVMAIGRWKQ